MTKFTKEQLIEDLKASTQNASGMFEISEDTICALMSMLTSAAPQLPQPAVFVPSIKPDWMNNEFNSGWNSCRAAMLQGSQPVSNRDELPLDYLQGHKDGLEWAAQLAEANHPQTGDWLYDDPTELAKAIRKGPDMPPVEPGNSPVIPDGWVACSERLPPEGYEPDGGAVCYLVWHKNEVDCGPQYSISNVFFLRKHWEKNFTHWMPLPAAPQQEVK
ncbi:TPA: DUF551 domain-containing protein [Citrobacter amalonaticus]|uniref:DUF551 domain-containing protein n=1 Tax=Citrobacter amalonaticus TaxID=35703 RepID=UPI00388D663B|nr:DUF551 domain-containing protein [Citrobacter amalonaticus]